MRQHELAPSRGSHHPRKRVGRGDGSGHGNYSCRGAKGQKARSGPGPRPGFEGGQLPLIKRLPSKRGFVNIFRIPHSIVNIGSLSRFPAGSQVTPQTLLGARLVKSLRQPIKVLGQGKLGHPLVVQAHSFSHSAQGKLEAAGGRAEVIAG
ncbi:MAG: 50S ribosomal protein L15 [Chloroflexi bacterium]|nr:50S ribosomal protein L15 [Chloroflexota bacterium]